MREMAQENIGRKVQPGQSNAAYGVIWDMDGVIVDTAQFHFRAWKKAVEERGTRFDESDFKRTFGMRTPDIIRIIFGDKLQKSQVAEIARRKEEYYRQMAKGNVAPLPGAIELIKALRAANFRQAIASSAPRENVELVVNSLGIRELLQAIVTEEDVQAGKPDPQMFLTAARRLGVEPDSCLVIEDSIAGVEAARRGGMKCAAVSNTHHPSRLADADLVVDSLRRLSVDVVYALLLTRK